MVRRYLRGLRKMLELARQLKSIVLALIASNGKLKAENEDLKKRIADQNETIAVLNETIAATHDFDPSANG